MRISIALQLAILFSFTTNIYSQETPLGSKIVGNGDPLNYYIGHYYVDGSDGLDLHWHGGIRFGDKANMSVMQITNGNVGIGTNLPSVKLHVNNGDNSYGAILANASEFPFSLYTKTFNTIPDSESFRIGLKYLDNENNGFISFYRGGGMSGGFLGFSTNGQERIRISNVGNVGIGTNNPDSKLTVAGNIHAQEVKVTASAGTVPDYVFANNYKLKTLQEVEDYIKKNSHLPEIPSAKEIEKNGLMLAEMNMSLLKKIEELTLYSIEQNKKIEAQSKEIETLKDLVVRVTKIENKLSKK